MPFSHTMVKFSTKQSGRYLFVLKIQYSWAAVCFKNTVCIDCSSMKQKVRNWEFIIIPAKCPVEYTLWSSFCNSGGS